ncbi:Retrovirus-related Pol polyprotein from type-1 retrotransposable element R1 [Eumeta japonica]|uniref:Retrovirus-related Pol polyprotein from type-1 retrotransposable element R1 n=1 Tax=Eumeta variegata TaxID=151549 RepID=A0A4C1VLI3_EUMVA|nr:Retrovirus-related Pol polyprotein from type-1 retrotransposable element R1 [Eumeta japonica]
MGLDLVLVQDQYSGEPNLIHIGQHAKAGILACRSDATICMLAHLSTPHCLVGDVEPCDVHVLSCYFQYSEDIDRHLDHLDRVLNTLRGKRNLIGVDCNAHSPLWFCERRQYTRRGPEAEYRRQRMEGFVLGRGLIIHNQKDQPCTFAGPSGESNIDLTIGAEQSAGRVQPADEPVRFRDRVADWDRFESTIRFRIGRIPWGASAARVAETFTDVNSSKKEKGTAGARGRGGVREERALADFRRVRWEYRVAIRETQDEHYKVIADSGNVDPWGLAYRAASGCCLGSRGVVNGLALADGYACDTRGAMSGVLRALCPDDDPGSDTAYYSLVRVAAATTPSGRDAAPLGSAELGKIIGSLPHTAPALDGISSRIIRHVWCAAQQEVVRVYDRCVIEGVFPGVWKRGRLLVLPKGNGRAATDPKAYRPITLLSVLGKILERIFLKQAVNMTANLSASQHGFTVGRSTRTALNSILGTARDSTEKYVQCIFLDISGAFDNAWWPMILTKAKLLRIEKVAQSAHICDRCPTTRSMRCHRPSG